MIKAVITFLGILALAATLRAQIPSGNIFIGYSYTHANISPQSFGFLPLSRNANFNGWEGSLEGKFLPFLGVVADVTQSYGSANFTSVCLVNPPLCPPASAIKVTSRILIVTLGPQVSVPIGRFTPFAHALFGGAHVSNGGAAGSSDTAFATLVGGGIDYKFIKGVAWRFQGDEVHTRFFGGAQNDLRLSTGLVLRF